MSGLTGKLAAGFGFASEAYSHYSERKAQRVATAQNGGARTRSRSDPPLSRQPSESSSRQPQTDRAQLKPERTRMARPSPARKPVPSYSNEQPESPDDPPPKYEDDQCSTGYPDEKKGGYPDEKRQAPMSETGLVRQGDNDDERAWELDEAQDEIERNEYAELPPRPAKGKDVIGSFLSRAPPPIESPHGASRPHLQFPVVIPQRRPKERERGFVRAYAPDLEQFGIDEETFVDFIQTFNEASSASNWIHALNLAQFATIPMPIVVGIVASVAIEVTTTIALEVDGRVKTNASLKRINDEYFRPRGLYCIVLTYNPDSVGGAGAFSKLISERRGGWSDKLKSSSGNPFGAYEFPETAPLVYPALDYMILKDEEKTKGFRYKMKRSKAFIDDYMDRRAQARFHDENTGHALASAPRPQFRSRFADPGYTSSLDTSLGRNNDRNIYDRNNYDRNYDRNNYDRNYYDGNYYDRDPNRNYDRSNVGPLGLITNVAYSLTNGNQRGENQRGGGMPPPSNRGPIGELVNLVGIVGSFAATKMSENRSPSPASTPSASAPSASGRTGYGRNDQYSLNRQGNYNGQSNYARQGNSNDRDNYNGYGPEGDYGYNGYRPNGYGRNSPYDQYRGGQGQYNNGMGRRNPQTSGGGSSRGGGLTGGIKKLINSNVLYLMIVNMPSEQELADVQSIATQYVRQNQNQTMYNTEGAYCDGSSSFAPPPGPPPRRNDSPSGYGGGAVETQYAPPPGPPPPPPPHQRRHNSGSSHGSADRYPSSPARSRTPSRHNSVERYDSSQSFAPPPGPPPRSNPGVAPQGYHTPSPQHDYHSSQGYGVDTHEHDDMNLGHEYGPPPSYDQVSKSH